MEDAVDLLDEGEHVLHIFIADFEDAFHPLGFKEDEFKYLFAKHPEGGFVNYRTVLCGGAACPLVWGRGAAFLGRSGQALFTESELRLQIYVDDPAALISGSPEHARHKALVLCPVPVPRPCACACARACVCACGCAAWWL